MTDEVTILVPLHRSAPHLAVVEDNLRRLAPRFRVVVSDATGEDDTLGRLRERWAHEPTIEFLGPRPIGRGWVEHYNDLLARCRTDWFLWLPHDDTVDVDYVDRCHLAARSVPGAVGAFGRIEAEVEPGAVHFESPMCAPGVVPGGVDGAVAALDAWNLGVAFRSVFRRSGARPIAHTTVDDEWADVVWVFGRLLDGPLVHVDDAVYCKRYHSANTHVRWRAEIQGPLLGPFLAAELLRDDASPAPAPARALRSLAEWSAGHSLRTFERRRAEVADQEERGDALQAALETEHAAVERLRSALAEVSAERDEATRALTALRASATWRIGAVVGAIARLPGRSWAALRRRRRSP